ncbi:anion permease [Candidatus Bipolaricaulota bacterium]|nr:anion permease [Candidatus Bipolaricaulota bacterium]
MASLIVLLLAGTYLGWNIGANDAGNCLGTVVGSGMLSYRRAVIIVSIAALAGATLQGSQVMETIGTGIVSEQLPFAGVLVSLLSAGIFVTVATVLGLPVSTGEAIVGAVAGVGWSAGLAVNTGTLLTIAEVWVICPILTGLISFVLYHLLSRALSRTRGLLAADRFVHGLLLASSAYVAFTMGASNAGKAVGPIANLDLGINERLLPILGGVALVIGILSFGKRVASTIGGGIVKLDPLTAGCAQTAAAIAIHTFTLAGIPVSTSQAVVGAVIGVGIVKGMRTVRGHRVARISLGWIATPTASALLAFLVYRLVDLFL